MFLLLRSGASADRRKLFRSFSDGGALPRRRYANPGARIFMGAANDSPSPWGEGRVEEESLGRFV
jgi:hypothetical protein